MATRKSGGIFRSPGFIGSIWLADAENLGACWGVVDGAVFPVEAVCAHTPPAISRPAQATAHANRTGNAARVPCFTVSSPLCPSVLALRAECSHARPGRRALS